MLFIKTTGYFHISLLGYTEVLWDAQHPNFQNKYSDLHEIKDKAKIQKMSKSNAGYWSASKDQGQPLKEKWSFCFDRAYLEQSFLSQNRQQGHVYDSQRYSVVFFLKIQYQHIGGTIAIIWKKDRVEDRWRGSWFSYLQRAPRLLLLIILSTLLLRVSDVNLKKGMYW